MKAPLPRTHEVDIEGTRYLICRMNPLVGSWLAAQLFTLMMPAQLEQQFVAELNKAGEIENFAPVKPPANRKQMTEDEFHNLQNHCLLVCRYYDEKSGKALATPIMTPDGQFIAPGLADDVVAVMVLTLHSLFFNMKPFFDRGRMETVIQSFREVMEGSKSGASIHSMPSASGQ